MDKKRVRINEDLTAEQLAERLGVSVVEVLKRLFLKGIMPTVKMVVELDTARELAVEMGYELTGDDEPPDEQGAPVLR